MAERGLTVDYSTIARWVQAYAPALEKRVKPQLKPTNDAWRVDETYIKGQGQWVYPYRAVDSDGHMLDFRLSTKRDAEAAPAFFEKTRGAPHTVQPRVINVDKNAAYPKAVETLKALEHLAAVCELRQVKYLNNRIEQDHRFIKRRARPGLGFFSFDTAERTLVGIEPVNLLRKGQVKRVDKGDVLAQVHLINSLFGVAASRSVYLTPSDSFPKPIPFLQQNPPETSESRPAGYRRSQSPPGTRLAPG
jgi:IS6 family transposase